MHGRNVLKPRQPFHATVTRIAATFHSTNLSLMTSLLDVQDIEKDFTFNTGWLSTKTVRALHPVSFQLNSGETIAIVGETGAGKSTLAKILSGADQQTSGKILLQGKTLTENTRRFHFQNIRMIFQDPTKSLNNNHRIGQTLALPLAMLSNLTGAEAKARIKQTLLKVGLLPEHADYYPHMFSGGQLQRVALARALIVEPQILVLDEAVASLDPSIRAQIINLLLELQKESQMSYVLVTHHLGLVRHISDTTLVLYKGKVVEYDKTQAVFENPKHDYTKKLIASHSM